MNEVTRFIVEPKTLSEAMELGKLIANSSFCPTAMRGKPGDVILAIEMGAEVGLSKMQALQNIAVINGKPCLYGDGALAVAMSCAHYISHREWFEGSIEEETLTAFCAVTRKNSEEYIKPFSMADAKKAGLWSKVGVWQQYPQRMLQMRARAFAIRDKFADALRGIRIAEEVQDYQVIEKKKPNAVITQSNVVSAVIDVNPVTGEVEISQNEKLLDYILAEMETADTMDKLQASFANAKIEFKGNKKYLERINYAKDMNKLRLEFVSEMDIDQEEDNSKLDE
jgi:hypothetical protein